MNQTDPIFKLSQPAFFAHRGGAAEAPESTVEAFLYALGLGANIIEVDIQLSKDGEPVVWHGPELDITIDKDGLCMENEYVSCWDLKDLESKLWVRHPTNENETPEERFSENRRIISLIQLVDFVRDVQNGEYGPELSERPIHLNLELKKISSEGDCKDRPSWTQSKAANKEEAYPYLNKVLDILDDAPENVTIVAGSADHKILSSLRKIQNGNYFTNLSAREQLAYAGQFETSRIEYIGKLGPIPKVLLKGTGWLFNLFYKKKEDLSEYAFETPSAVISQELVDEVHDSKGGIYAFLSPFPALEQPEKDYCDDKYDEYRDRIGALLKWGVDGLMTDHPSELSKVLKELGYPK